MFSLVPPCLRRGARTMIQAFLICEEPLFCQYLKDGLSEFDGFVVCGEAAPERSSIETIIQAQPDLIIIETADPENYKFVDELIAVIPGQRVFWIWQQLNSRAEKMALSHHVAALFARDEELKVLVRNARALLE